MTAISDDIQEVLDEIMEQGYSSWIELIKSFLLMMPPSQRDPLIALLRSRYDGDDNSVYIIWEDFDVSLDIILSRNKLVLCFWARETSAHHQQFHYFDTWDPSQISECKQLMFRWASVYPEKGLQGVISLNKLI